MAARLAPLALITIALALMALGILIASGSPAHYPDRPRDDIPGTEGQRASLQRFIEAGGDVCSLRWSDSAEFPQHYATLGALMSAADAVITGHAVRHTVLPPDPGTIASRVLTTIQVDDVLVGEHFEKTFQLEYGHRVHGFTDSPLTRFSPGLDLCVPGRVALFISHTQEQGVYTVPYDGWAQFDGQSVQTPKLSQLFREYSSSQALIDGVRDIAGAALRP